MDTNKGLKNLFIFSPLGGTFVIGLLATIAIALRGSEKLINSIFAEFKEENLNHPRDE